MGIDREPCCGFDRPREDDAAKDTVLVVDDEPAVRQMVRILLESTDHEVLEARDGVEAMEVARTYGGHIDLLLADIYMPRMDGLELGRQFAQVRPCAPIVYMSARTTSDLTVRVITEGRAFLAKPFRAGTLIFKVREMIHGSSRKHRRT